MAKSAPKALINRVVTILYLCSPLVVADEEFAAHVGAAAATGVHGAVFGRHRLDSEALEEPPDIRVVVDRHQKLPRDLAHDLGQAAKVPGLEVAPLNLHIIVRGLDVKG